MYWTRFGKKVPPTVMDESLKPPMDFDHIFYRGLLSVNEIRYGKT